MNLDPTMSIECKLLGRSWRISFNCFSAFRALTTCKSRSDVNKQNPTPSCVLSVRSSTRPHTEPTKAPSKRNKPRKAAKLST